MFLSWPQWNEPASPGLKDAPGRYGKSVFHVVLQYRLMIRLSALAHLIRKNLNVIW